MLQVVDAGVFILRAFMNEYEQLQCYRNCRELYKKDEKMYKKHGSISNILNTIKTPHRGRYLLAFEPNKTVIDDYYNKLAQSAFDHLYSQILKHKQCDLILKTLPRKLPTKTNNGHKNEKQLQMDPDEVTNTNTDCNSDSKESNDNDNDDDDDKNEWISDRLNCVLYPLGSMLGRHVDNMDGWVVLFSFGCDARFYLQLLSNKRRKHGVVVNMKSGDVIIFEGGSKERVLHGVDSIVNNTAPKHFNGILSNARIGLQLRQYIGIVTHKS